MFASNTRQYTYFLTIALLIAAAFVVDIPFFDPAGLILVFGGTYIAGAVSYGFKDVHAAVEEALTLAPYPKALLVNRISFFSEVSKASRVNGARALETFARQESDPILKKGLQLIADQVSYNELKHTLNLEYEFGKEQRSRSVEVLMHLAQVAPAAGLIGTVLGLVSMMAGIDSPSALSSGMSMALLTTLYGAVLSYLVLQPLATRLKGIISTHEKVYLLHYEGVLAIAGEVNPQLIEERLEAFAM